MEGVVAIILAGGTGERLGTLAVERTKPAIPFGGKYRIIDFTLSNCVNSGIYNVAILTQYQPRSLTDHIGIGMPWGFAHPDSRIQLLHPYLAREEGRDWYKGTADAVYQNLQFIEEQGAELVLILSGDHVYKMDYKDMIDSHLKNQADVTIAVTRLPKDELIHFGTVTVDDNQQVDGFQEKVKEPKSDLVSMGVYVFQRELLSRILEEDAQRRSSKHDFGRNIFPQLVGNCRLYAYNFEGYWQDVGTIRSYWEASMRLLDSPPSISFSADWPIRTKEDEPRSPAIISRRGDVVNSSDRVTRISTAWAEKPQGHDGDIPGDASDAVGVVANCPDRARNMGAVSIGVHRIGVVVVEVVAVDVIDVAITVIVDAVAGNFTRVDPDVVGEIRMGVIDAGVDHGDHDII